MKYPGSFIDRVRGHFLVSEVVGRRIPVKKHGREYQAVCPFHSEKTPSFTINDEKGFYHCFGCSAHGDVITFVKEYEGISWTEALERLARDAGIALPVMTREQQVKIRQMETLYDVIDEAAKWFELQLTSSHGRMAQDYVRGRGLLPATLAHFRVGYAPPQRDALKKHLISKGVSESQIVQAGLAITPDNGMSYDRFRGRLIFPIKDITGRIVAFGGRLLSADADGPKYLNSPETELFKKGELLYNFSDARKSAMDKKSVIVTEGYMDTVSLWQAGITHVVAPLGTAMTEHHLALLWRLCDEPVICLDGDAAGKRAMLRAAELALPRLAPGKSLSFALLPEGEDPDSLVKAQGADAMYGVVTHAIGLAKLIWDMMISTGDYSTPEKQAALEKRIEATAAKITDPTVRNYYQKHLKEKMWSHFSSRRDGFKRVREEVISSHELARSISAARSPMLKLEQQFIKMILIHPQLMDRHEVEEALSALDTTDATLHRMRGAMGQWYMDGGAESGQGLQPFLAANGLEIPMKKLLSDMFIDVEKNPEMAYPFWQEVKKRLHLAQVKEEERMASVRMAAELTDESFEQFSSLWKIPNN